MSPEAELLTVLEGSARVLLTGPIDSDGDSLGACLSLQLALRRRGVAVDVGGEASYRYRAMPGVGGLIPDARIQPIYDAVVILDGDRHRLSPKTDAAFAAARVKAIVDHHASTTDDGYAFAWIDPAAASTCEMVFRALEGWGVPLDPELAELLYVGLIFDTGGFRYSNTSPATHEMARALLSTGIDHAAICVRTLMERQQGGVRVAGHVFSTARFALDGELALGWLTKEEIKRFGMVPGDLEGVVDSLVYTRGVQVAVLLTERRPGLVKASLRSRGLVDVAAVAQQLSVHGGGHQKAAGAAIDGDLDQVSALVEGAVAAALRVAREA
ncbi:MAG: bifunctional oligoribonuclease/PAP phosphatase NrnA [Deltaproteobacteria bacterium]|nr:bifunctional oligoribonuclease/PAP phosphatase NrnA [Deltaproteobacteria bacterium]